MRAHFRARCDKEFHGRVGTDHRTDIAAVQDRAWRAFGRAQREASLELKKRRPHPGIGRHNARRGADFFGADIDAGDFLDRIFLRDRGGGGAICRITAFKTSQATPRYSVPVSRWARP